MAEDGTHLNVMRLESPLTFVEVCYFELFWQCA